MKRRSQSNLLDLKSQSIIEYRALAFHVEISSKDQQSKHALSTKIIRRNATSSSHKELLFQHSDLVYSLLDTESDLLTFLGLVM